LLIDKKGLAIELEVRDGVPYLSENSCSKRRVIVPALPVSPDAVLAQEQVVPPPPGLELVQHGGCGNAPPEDEELEECEEPDPNGLRTEAVLRAEALSTKHIMLHLPKNKYCYA